MTTLEKLKAEKNKLQSELAKINRMIAEFELQDIKKKRLAQSDK